MIYLHSSASLLVRRLKEAREMRGALYEAMRDTETTVPKEKLNAWREEEQRWLSKVVDLKEHENLWNPYEIAKTEGTGTCGNDEQCTITY